VIQLEGHPGSTKEFCGSEKKFSRVSIRGSCIDSSMGQEKYTAMDGLHQIST